MPALSAEDHHALLEWSQSLEVPGRRPESLDDLSDGEFLLQVMHDLSPDIFPGRSRSLGTINGALQGLLSGLIEHFKDRPGHGEVEARRLLARAQRNGDLDPSQLTQLVIWATLDNELPKQQHYVEICQQLSQSSATVVMMVAEQFSSADCQSPFDNSTPPSPSGANSFGMARPHFSEVGASPGADEKAPRTSGDFLEVGLDAETRFRRLKEHYIALKEEQERWDEERASLRWELETERVKRQEAEEAERRACTELRLAEEARDRVKEDQRSIFELRIEQEVSATREELRRRDREAETLREELEVATAQAQAAQKLQSQLEMFKKKIEECQAWKREKEELRKQLDEISSARQAGSAAGNLEHLHSRLALLREQVEVASRERDEAHHQSELMQAELNKLKASQNLDVEERLWAAGGSRGEASTVPSPATIPSLASEKESSALIEKLLAEKERATRAETTLQLKQAEVTSLTEQRSKDAAQIASLEVQVQQLQRDALTSGSKDSGKSVDDSKVQALQAQLSLRERELQVHNWRGRAESSSLLAQEVLMASCFHELGLRYQQLRVQHDILKLKLEESRTATKPG